MFICFLKGATSETVKKMGQQIFFLCVMILISVLYLDCYIHSLGESMFEVRQRTVEQQTSSEQVALKVSNKCTDVAGSWLTTFSKHSVLFLFVDVDFEYVQPCKLTELYVLYRFYAFCVFMHPFVVPFSFLFAS